MSSAARIESCIALLFTSSCGGGDVRADAVREERPTVYIGAVDGTDAKIALARAESRWAAYLCGGTETLTSMTAWFQGGHPSVPGVDVHAVTHDKEIEASFAGDDVTGSVTIDGTPTRFEAVRVQQGGAVGLFLDDSNGCRSGLIVPEADGGEPQGVYCADLEVAGAGGPSFEQVTPIAPLRLRDGFLLARTLSRSDVVLQLRPIALPLDSN